MSAWLARESIDGCSDLAEGSGAIWRLGDRALVEGLTEIFEEFLRWLFLFEEGEDGLIPALKEGEGTHRLAGEGARKVDAVAGLPAVDACDSFDEWYVCGYVIALTGGRSWSGASEVNSQDVKL